MLILFRIEHIMIDSSKLDLSKLFNFIQYIHRYNFIKCIVIRDIHTKYHMYKNINYVNSFGKTKTTRNHQTIKMTKNWFIEILTHVRVKVIQDIVFSIATLINFPFFRGSKHDFLIYCWRNWHEQFCSRCFTCKGVLHFSYRIFDYFL